MIVKKLAQLTILIALFLIAPTSIFASTLSLSPGNGSISTTGTTTVSVRLNGAEGINAVSAILTYPADKLQVSYVSGSGAFSISAENSFGGGGIRISRGSFSPVSGSVAVATIGFKGKEAGTATVSFTSESSAYKASDNANSLSGTSGGTYKIVQGSAPSTGKNQDNSTKDATKPFISKLIVDNITTNSAQITWVTNENSDSLVEYGIDAGKYFLSALSSELVQKHAVNLEGPALSPGIKYHFRVKSKDSSGNTAQGDDTIFQLLGYTVKIKVVDQYNVPLTNAKLILYSDPVEATTNNQGIATFKNVTAGKHVAVVKLPNAEKSVEIDVKEKNETQNFQAIVNRTGGISLQQNSLVFIIGLIVILIIVGGILILLKRRKQIHPPITNSPINPPSSIQQ